MSFSNGLIQIIIAYPIIGYLRLNNYDHSRIIEYDFLIFIANNVIIFIDADKPTFCDIGY